MAIPKFDKHEKYNQYADHCVKMAMIARDQKSHIIKREMAVEWLMLADPVPAKSRSG